MSTTEATELRPKRLSARTAGHKVLDVNALSLGKPAVACGSPGGGFAVRMVTSLARKAKIAKAWARTFDTCHLAVLHPPPDRSGVYRLAIACGAALISGLAPSPRMMNAAQ